MGKIKNYIILALFVLCVGFSIYNGILSSKLHSTQIQLENTTNNVKAYELENSKISSENRQFLLTVEQLNESKDSLIEKLNAVRKDLKVKDKYLKELQYIAFQNRKVDSVFVKDTIFLEKVLIDTTLTNEWVKLNLHLEHPNKIVADYSFNNEEIIVTSTKRETIDPPKKCWLGRVFQKKQTVVVVDVVQQNPYCINKVQKHVKILE